MPRALGTSKYGTPTYNQAYKICARFNGARTLAEILKLDYVAVYRWSYPRPIGCDGLIPTIQVDRIRQAARINGVILTPEDWLPEKLGDKPIPTSEARRTKFAKKRPKKRQTTPSKPLPENPTLDDLLQ